MLCCSSAGDTASTCETESPRALNAEVVAGAPCEEDKTVVDLCEGEVVFGKARNGQAQVGYSSDSSGHSPSYQVSTTEGG